MKKKKFKPVTQDFADGFVRGMLAGWRNKEKKLTQDEKRHKRDMFVAILILGLTWAGILYMVFFK